MKKWKLMKQISELKRDVKEWEFNAESQHEQAIDAQMRADRAEERCAGLEAENAALKVALGESFDGGGTRKVLP